MIEVIDAKMDTSFLRDGYADFIKRWTHEEEGEFRDNRFHASGLGLCKRQQVARRAGFNGRPSTEDKESMFAEANFIHAGMTNFWLKTGTAIAREQRFLDLPLEMLTGEQVGTILHSPFPGWTGKFDALAHRPEWCGCGKASKDIAATWGEMVLRYNLQDPDWMIYRDVLKKHLILPVSLKTVHPNGLRHYVNGPKLHNVWQDSWYVAAANKAYGLEWDRFIIMYRGRGGGGMPFFFIVKALDVEPLQADYEEAWRTYEEEHHMPPVLDLEAAIVEDKTWGEIVRLSTSWQCDYCLVPETRVLMADLRWKPIGEVQLGEQLLAFDEEHQPGLPTHRGRQMKIATVTSKHILTRPCHRLHMADGTEIIASNEHKWLANGIGTDNCIYQWAETQHLTAGRNGARPNLLKVCDVWDEPLDRRAGYLAAAFDGEGYVSCNSGLNVCFAQKDNEMMAVVRTGLADLGFEWGEQGRSRDDCLRIRIESQFADKLRFLGQVRPQRLLQKVFDKGWLSGRSLVAKEAVQVSMVGSVGERGVVALGTSTGTFIAEGFASHNCDHADWTNNDGGFRCEPMCTKNKTSDRVAIIRDGTITAIQEWYEKSGYTMEYVHRCVEQMQDRENVRYKWDVKPTDRCFK